MVESRQVRQQKKKKGKKEDESSESSVEKKKKLKELDNFIEGVLQEAGEDFLEEFKQIEGE